MHQCPEHVLRLVDGVQCELMGVQSNFNPVIEQSKQGSKRECNDKDGDEAILNDCRERRGERGKERKRDRERDSN